MPDFHSGDVKSQNEYYRVDQNNRIRFYQNSIHDPGKRIQIQKNKCGKGNTLCVFGFKDLDYLW